MVGSGVSGSCAKYVAPAGLRDEGGQLKCTPITLYQSEPPESEFLGNQIAVCDLFVSYAIKGGKIRVLTRSSATRTLLRGHGATIVDLSFSCEDGAPEAWLASACAQGALVLWRVAEAPDAEEVIHEKVCVLETCGASRVAWRPGPNKHLAIAIDEGAKVVRLEACSEEELGQLEEMHHEARINDLRWSGDGESLATASDDGYVKCYRAPPAFSSSRTNERKKYGLFHVRGASGDGRHAADVRRGEERSPRRDGDGRSSPGGRGATSRRPLWRGVPPPL